MRSREEVLAEFGITPTHASMSYEREMAARIRELESQQAASEPVAWALVQRVAVNIRANLESLPHVAEVWADDLEKALAHPSAAAVQCDDCDERPCICDDGEARTVKRSEAGVTGAFIDAKVQWSRETFGPGTRTAGICNHIRKELVEAEQKPHDVTEWADIILLAMDGAVRAGATGDELVRAVIAKDAANRDRTWPDWRTLPADAPIEHEKPSAAGVQCDDCDERPCICDDGEARTVKRSAAAVSVTEAMSRLEDAIASGKGVALAFTKLKAALQRAASEGASA